LDKYRTSLYLCAHRNHRTTAVVKRSVNKLKQRGTFLHTQVYNYDSLEEKVGRDGRGEERKRLVHQAISPFSEIEFLRCSLLLTIENILLCLLEISHRHSHATLTKSKQTRLSAHCLDIGSTQIVLGSDEVIESNVVSHSHSRGVDLKDSSLGLLIGEGEFDLSVDTTRSDQGGVERFDAVSRHQDLDVSSRVESVELIEKLQHSTLNLAFSSRVRIVSLGSYGVNLIDEHDGGRMLLSHTEQLTHHLGSVSEYLLDELGSDNSEEGGRCLIGDCLRKKSLSSAGATVEDDSLGRLDSHFLVVLGMSEGQFDCLLDLLNLLVESSHISVRLLGSLLQLHHRHHGISVVRQHSYDGVRLVVEKDGAAWFQSFLVDEGEDVHVVFTAHIRAHNRVMVVDDFLERTNSHRSTAQLSNLGALLLLSLLLGLESLLVLDELLLHQQIVLDALRLE
ncbi:hypothetical protein PFISCL1PPCAC_747, partial [Pristionchus fissidentatus]